MKVLLSILTITLLGLIACGGKGGDWAIPEEYQNLSLDQLKAQSTINSTEGLMERQGTAAYNTAVDDSYHSTVAEDKLGQLGYFEGELDGVTQRKSDPTVYDVWFCIGERRQDAIKGGAVTHTCAEEGIIFVAFKTDRGPSDIAIGKKMRVAGILEDRQKKVSRHDAYNTITYFPKFRLIKAEYN
jgi:hypothetical protein